MKIGAFGCSFLYGSDLSDIEDYKKSTIKFRSSRITYPALIAKKYNLEYYCTALPAQSNKIIADDILRAIAQQGNSILYVINWTWIDRHEYIGNDTRFKSGNPGWQQIVPTDTTQEASVYYKYFYSDLDAKLQNLMFIHTVLCALQENNCKFIMTYMDDLLFDSQWHCPSSISYLQNNIYPFMDSFEGKNFVEWAKQNKFKISENLHPLEQAHQAAAEYWLPKVRTLLNSSTKEEYNASK